jgi:hypothetical protein
MNARTEQIDDTGAEEDGNFAAVSEVEAGIRDFVRNDIAYLRRLSPKRLRRWTPAPRLR